MRFQLTIYCDNAAFGDDEQDRADEVARVLIDVIPRLLQNHGNVSDSNGNHIGSFHFIEEVAS